MVKPKSIFQKRSKSVRKNVKNWRKRGEREREREREREKKG